MQLVKICRVKDIHTARLCGDLGVNFIGLHAIQGLDCENSARYLSIVQELEQGYPNTIPVLVTKVIDPDQLILMLSATNISWIQLHVPLTNTLATYIRETIADRIGEDIKFILTVAVNDPHAKIRIRELTPIANYILLDSSYEGGTGIEANLVTLTELVQLAFPTPVLIAGGINSKNARALLEATQASGIDVQSGVQTDNISKNKDPLLIAKLMSNVRGVDVHAKPSKYLARAKLHRLVSLAITSVDSISLDETLLRFRDTPIDLIHADFSNRTIAPEFEASPLLALDRLSHLISCMPYDVHLFIDDINVQRSIISSCKELNPLLRLVFLHIRNPNDVSESLFDSTAGLCSEFGLDFGLAIQASGFSGTTLGQFLKVISKYQCGELSLITHSRAHSLHVIITHDLHLLKLLVSWSHESDRLTPISVDRDMTLEKLGVLSEGKPNHVIAGNSLLSSDKPYDLIESYKKLLSPLNRP